MVLRDNSPWLVSAEESRRRRAVINKVRNEKKQRGAPQTKDGGSLRFSGQRKPTSFPRYGFIPRKMIKSLHMVEVADALQRGYIIKESRIETEDRCCHVHKAFVSSGKMERDEKIASIVEQLGHDNVYFKVINKSKASSKYMEDMVYKEVKTLAALPFHPSIVNMLETFETSLNFYHVTEYTDSNSLQTMMATDALYPPGWEGPGLPEDFARIIFYEVCEGLRHCHLHGVAHRDLCCEKILVTSNLQAKITGFSSAKQVPNKRHLVGDCVADIAYAAPEAIRGQPHDPYSADVWSLGVVLYVMLNGQEPYGELSLLHQQDHTHMVKLRMVRSRSNEATSLVHHLLQWDPLNRPSIDDVLAHPWLTRLKCVSNKYRRKKQSWPSDLPKRDLVPHTRIPDKFYNSKVADPAVVMVNQSERETITLKSRRPTKGSSFHRAGMHLPAYVTKRSRNQFEGILPHYMVSELGFNSSESPRNLGGFPVLPGVADVSQVSDEELVAWLAAGVNEEELVSPIVSGRSNSLFFYRPDMQVTKTPQWLLPDPPRCLCSLPHIEECRKDENAENSQTHIVLERVEEKEVKEKSVELQIPNSAGRNRLPPLQKSALQVSMKFGLPCTENERSEPINLPATENTVQMKMCKTINTKTNVQVDQEDPNNGPVSEKISVPYETDKNKTTKISCNIEESEESRDRNDTDQQKGQGTREIWKLNVKSPPREVKISSNGAPLPQQTKASNDTKETLYTDDEARKDERGTVSADQIQDQRIAVVTDDDSADVVGKNPLESDQVVTNSKVAFLTDNTLYRTSPNTENSTGRPLKTRFVSSGSTSKVATTAESRKSEGVLTGKACKRLKTKDEVDQWCEQVLREYEKMARARSLPLPEQYLTSSPHSSPDIGSAQSSTLNLSRKQPSRPATMPMQSPRDTNKYFTGSLGCLNEKNPTWSGSNASVKSRHSSCSIPVQNSTVVPPSAHQAKPAYRMAGYRTLPPRNTSGNPGKADILKIEFNDEVKGTTVDKSPKTLPRVEDSSDVVDTFDKTGETLMLCNEVSRQSDINSDRNLDSNSGGLDDSQSCEVPFIQDGECSESGSHALRVDDHVEQDFGEVEMTEATDCGISAIASEHNRSNVAQKHEIMSSMSSSNLGHVNQSKDTHSERMPISTDSEDKAEKYVSLISIDESITGSVPQASTKLVPSLQPHNRDLFWCRHLYGTHSAVLSRGRGSTLSNEQIVSKNLMAIQDLPINTQRAISLCSSYSVDQRDRPTALRLHIGTDSAVSSFQCLKSQNSVQNAPNMAMARPNVSGYRKYRSHLTAADSEPEILHVANVQFPRRDQRLLKYRHKRGEMNRSETHMPKLRVVLDKNNIPIVSSETDSQTAKFRHSAVQKGEDRKLKKKQMIVHIGSFQ